MIEATTRTILCRNSCDLRLWQRRKFWCQMDGTIDRWTCHVIRVFVLHGPVVTNNHAERVNTEHCDGQIPFQFSNFYVRLLCRGLQMWTWTCKRTVGFQWIYLHIKFANIYFAIWIFNGEFGNFIHVPLRKENWIKYIKC